MQFEETDAEREAHRGRGFRHLILALLGIGLVARIVPIVAGSWRMFRQYPSEDGYLMLTIARNLALGNGMSTADGTIPTNGTQPLVNFLWGAGLWLFDADRTAGVAWALAWEVLFGALATWTVYILGKRLLSNCSRGKEIAALGACAWYAQMLSCMHGMNCLETGAYALVILFFAVVFVGKDGDPLRAWSTKRSIGLGLLLGVVFWVRIDAVFLIAAVCLVRALIAPGYDENERSRFGIGGPHLHSAIITGATSVIVASPWLAYNKLEFGSFTPISGTAQSFDRVIGQNIQQAIANTAEYALVVFPIPQPIETHPIVSAVLALALLTTAIAIFCGYRRGTLRLKAWTLVFAVFFVGLFGYYGLLFGAPHFVSRYLYPLSPFLALSWAGIVFFVIDRIPLLRSNLIRIELGCLLVALMAYPNLRLYKKKPLHGHFQAVEWIDANVPEDEWVCAVQTGTIGYFHDKTLNLDGKVNPEALEAVLAVPTQIPQYMVERELAYFADWQSHAFWLEEFPILGEHYDLVVNDPVSNLAVFAWKKDRKKETETDEGERAD